MVKFNLPLHYIQNIRFTLSLAEAGIPICIDDKWKDVFNYLNEFWDINVQTCDQGSKIDFFSFDHEIPLVTAGSVQKNLIFPKMIIVGMMNKWSKNRDIEFLFVGLMTKKRLEVLDSWVSDQTGSKIISFKQNILRFFKKKMGLVNSTLVDQIHIIESSRGRTFPVKAWDVEYYNQMLSCKFVLCPNGDFIWTYRFFEAIMCGAIPVVEDSCEMYNGFKYYTFKESSKELIYDEAIVKHNYELLKTNFSFSDSDVKVIKKEIQKLLL